MNDSRQ